MKRILIIFFAISFGVFVKAQHLSGFNNVPVQKLSLLSQAKVLSPSGACDTANFDEANGWSAYYYTYGANGFVFGTSNNTSSGFKIIEDANLFDLSTDTYNYISGGLVYFAKGNSNITADMDKDVYFTIYEYDEVNDIPGAMLGSTSVKLSQVKNDVQNNNLTEFKFSSPIAIPSSKKFLASIDHSNFEWKGGTRDSIAIVANGDGEAPAAAYQNLLILLGGTNQWIPVNQLWSSGGNPIDVNLYVFPYVSNTSDGCGLLPVSIINFGGMIKDFNAYLNWSTAGESNNKGFEVERSKDGQNFESVGFVTGAGNSNKITNYTFTDGNLKNINASATYYRLKQVDYDGKFTFSNVLALKPENNLVWRVYPNPVKDAATVEVNLDVPSALNVQVITRDGRMVINSSKGILPQGTNQVTINTQALAKGSYFIRLTIGGKTYTSAFIK